LLFFWTWRKRGDGRVLSTGPVVTVLPGSNLNIASEPSLS
jgi:hypothetical protein